MRQSTIQKRRMLVLAAISLLLSACTAVPESGSASGDGWPSEMPEQKIFVGAFEQDRANQEAQSQRDYLTWVVRFYRGWALYPRGWNWLTAEVLDSVDEPERSVLERQMFSLGERIAAEWAKDRDHRFVNTNHLMIWGDALKIAVREGSQLTLASQISDDVDGLLVQRLDPGQIELDRYLSSPSDVAVEELDDFETFDDAFSDPFEA